MDVIDLPAQHESIYFECLEDWSEEMREAGGHKEAWYRRMKVHGLRVKLACDDRGAVGGMIQYMPAERTHIDGPGLYFIYCIWVHGYKQGRGDFRGQRMGRALLHAAEEDARSLGAAGMAAWGLMIPAFMRASWYKRRGYRVADREGVALLLWKPFSKEARAPRWRPVKKTPRPVPGQVTVTGFVNGWCPVQNMVFERARCAAEASGEGVVFEPHCTADPEVFAEWGITDAVYVDGRPVGKGPPLSYERMKATIDKRKRKLRWLPCG